MEREERVELEDPKLLQRGRGHLLDEGRQLEIVPLPPGVGQERGDQDRLTARQRVRVHTDEPEQGAHHAGDELGAVLFGQALPALRAREAVEQAHGDASVGAGGVDGDAGRAPVRPELLFAEAVAAEPRCPASRELGAKGRRAALRLRRQGGVHPAREFVRREVRPHQGEVREVAFGVDGDDRYTRASALLEQIDAQARLPTAGHAEDEAVGREVVGLDCHSL